MNTKTDPYATKLHKRIDALLFVFIPKKSSARRQDEIRIRR